LAVDVMNEFMHLFRRKAYEVMPEPTIDGVETNDKASPVDFERYAGITCELAKQLANYQSPKLRAIAVVAPPPPVNPEDLKKRFTLSIFEDGRRTAVAKVEPKPNGAGNGHDAQVVDLVANEVRDDEQ